MSSISLHVFIFRQLQHPNIVQVMGIDNLGNHGQLAILMALVNGPNLHELIFSGKHNVIFLAQLSVQ